MKYISQQGTCIIHLQMKRIEFLDAMRGFTMILVVSYHVFFDCITRHPESFFFNGFFCEFRMPLFFFVSGFVFYKSNRNWDKRTIIDFLKKKIPVQIITPLIFLYIWTQVIDISIFKAIAAPAKCGYWFTFVLFFYFIIYIFISILSKFLKFKYSKDIILIVLGIALYFTSQHIFLNHLHIRGILSLVEWIYFIFFVMGTLARKYYPQYEKLLDYKWTIPLLLLLFLVFNLWGEPYTYTSYNDNIIVFFCRLIGPIIVFAFFRKYQESFKSSTFLGRNLQYIGKRTLDIYLIHYFLVPKKLDLSFLNITPMPIIELMIVFFIGLAIVICCLVISNVIRISPLLSKHLFGAKEQLKNNMVAQQVTQ